MRYVMVLVAGVLLALLGGIAGAAPLASPAARLAGSHGGLVPATAAAGLPAGAVPATAPTPLEEVDTPSEEDTLVEEGPVYPYSCPECGFGADGPGTCPACHLPLVAEEADSPDTDHPSEGQPEDEPVVDDIPEDESDLASPPADLSR
ncbi:MAG: hypothetical protein GX442_06400 [Candidatus Riflebacteria bacterium]|nr:hypothetical protein [Candidatus Riflebacteria bacterium]